MKDSFLGYINSHLFTKGGLEVLNRFFGALVLIALLLFPVAAYAQGTPQVEIVDYGTYKLHVDRTEREVMVGHSASEMSKVSNVTLLKKTDKIPCTKDTIFGIRYVLKGVPKGESVLLQVRTLHPPMKNPDKGTLTSTQWSDDPKGGEINFVGHQFSDYWAMVPGKWTMQFYFQKKKIQELVFQVVPVESKTK